MGRHGDAAAKKDTDMSVALSSHLRVSVSPRRASRGFTLIELMITLTVLAILTLGVIPMVKTAVRRQREQVLREELREMREAIKEFHRDTIGSPYLSAAAGGIIQPPPPQQQQQQQQQGYIDPRSQVMIADATIFGVDNPDHYPPSLETLVSGVNVAPRQQAPVTTDLNKNVLDQKPELSFKKKVYLRAIPIDPMTGKADWCLRSLYDSPESGCSDHPDNVFDVRSRSDDKALNERDKYSDW